jgi:acetylornithine deacetylase/succinyl-diaminopimelate desuccinylase-like protein
MPGSHSNDSQLEQLIAALPPRSAIERTAIEIQQIPAPTFEEHERSEEVRRRFAALGLAEVEQDELGNVYGCRRGSSRGTGLMIVAHLDTVFQRTTDLAVRRAGSRICGPGIGDNSLGVAGLLHLAATIERVAPSLQNDIWYIADV